MGVSNQTAMVLINFKRLNREDFFRKTIAEAKGK